jgi:putative transposase
MPRTGRVVLPHTPHHVVHRGHDRNAVFVTPADYRYYLDTLREWKTQLGIELYAYCLMTNHVHLVLNPGERSEMLGGLMKRLGGRQTRYVNALEGRSGTLWEGRYKSSPIQSDTYLLACCRYVDLNPVRAGMVATPGEYPWSSYREKTDASNVADLVDSDPCYETLGASAMERQRAYAAFVSAAPSGDELSLIREALARGQLTGDQRFVVEVAQRIDRRIEHRRPGRPAKNPNSYTPRK